MVLIIATSISVISEDPIFTSQVKILDEKLGIDFKFMGKSYKELQADLFIVDACLLRTFLEKIINLSKIKFIVRGTQQDLKSAFDAGCSDFLKIPCNMIEFEMRIRNVLNLKLNKIKWQNITLRYDNIERDGFFVNINVQEYRILKLLVQNGGEPVPREALYFVLHGTHKKNSRVVDMHISNLRKKIHELGVKSELNCGNIKTVHNYGYIIY